MSARLLIRYRAAGQPVEWGTEDERGRALAGPAHAHAPPADAIAGAREPVRMARAMKLAVEAGRDAFLAGRIPMKAYASASSPMHGLVHQ